MTAQQQVRMPAVERGGELLLTLERARHDLVAAAGGVEFLDELHKVLCHRRGLDVPELELMLLVRLLLLARAGAQQQRAQAQQRCREFFDNCHIHSCLWASCPTLRLNLRKMHGIFTIYITF